MKIDAHQHFWDYARDAADYPWIDDPALMRDFGPGNLAPHLSAAGFEGCVAVQARAREADTGYLLGIAAEADFVKAVVGWVDLAAPEAAERIAAHAGDAYLRGIRMQVHDDPDPDFAASEAHRRGVGALSRFGLTYDLLLRPVNLPAAIRLVDTLPEQPFVIDHLAKPDLSGPRDDAWEAGMAAIARRENVWCKLSGLVTEAAPGARDTAPFGRYIERVLALFGPERLMIGSDWPVCTMAAPYAEAVGLIDRHIAALSTHERDAIRGRTACRFYGIKT